MDISNNLFYKKIEKKYRINDYNLKKIQRIAKKKQISESYALNLILDTIK